MRWSARTWRRSSASPRSRFWASPTPARKRWPRAVPACPFPTGSRRSFRGMPLAADDHRYIWHPFTQQQGWVDEDPVIVESAEGTTLTDSDGRQYIDGVSSLWCNVHGHRHPKIDEAVQAQLGKVAHSTLR